MTPLDETIDRISAVTCALALASLAAGIAVIAGAIVAAVMT